MIFDNIENIKNYMGLAPGLDHAIEMIASNQLDLNSVGKHTVDGDRLFYLVQEYDTKETFEVGLEAHKRYIDLQLMIDGDEYMDVANIRDLTESVAYNEATDFMLFDGAHHRILVKESEFMIFFPNDGHRPGIAIQSSSKVRKIVFKIACEDSQGVG